MISLTAFWLAASAAYVYMAWSSHGAWAAKQMTACCVLCYVALLVIWSV